MEVWVYLALGSALVAAFLNLSIKNLGSKIDEYAAGFIRNLVILPALWVFLIFVGIPKINPSFWTLILIMLPFEILLIIFYQKAFKLSPVSLIVPILSLSPIFIALISFLLFEENLSIVHFLALLCFVVGVYILKLKSSFKNILKPILSLVEDKGVLYMLFVAIILGVTVSLGKRAIVASSPEFFSAVYYSLITLLLFPIYKFKSKVNIKKFISNKKTIITLALLNPIYLLLIFNAFKIGPTALVQAVNSTNVLFTVILAGTFLKEKGIKKRVTASLFILLGAVLISLS